ncbi:MAG: hypothetical protein RLZZ450_2034 [Pseudomonadota bacterium]|jgi:hypothetical protein
MRRSLDLRAGIVALASALVCFGCPSQDLAALNPCTVSAASIRVDQGGISKVDLLFVIDNSNSMASEQVKIAEELPRLLSVLTNGDRYFGREDQVPAGLADKDRFFTKASSLHIGVVSSSMHVMDELPSGSNTGVGACILDDDDGKLRSSTEVAANGISVGMTQLVPPSTDCGELGAQPRYQDFEAGKEPSAEEVASAFACVSRLGIAGCPFEQQLEAMWKAVAPSDGDDPDLHTFLHDARGRGDPSGFNHGFVREDAILAVIQVSDEEDCSINEEGKQLFSYGEAATARFGPPNKTINLRCGQFGDAENLLLPASRYVRGLKSLKPNNQDRIIFAAIVGIPEDAIGRPLDEVLERDDMQFAPDPVFPTLPRASCTSVSAGGGAVDQAYPPRRFLEVAKGFGKNAVVYSICADDYAPALNTLIDRIAEKLTGNCLPRQLTPDEDGNVRCEVFELLAAGDTQCSKARGHLDAKPKPHDVKEQKGVVTRPGCRMAQVPVLDQKPSPNKTGWYYDDFGDGLDECQAGNRQRVTFTFGSLPPGASAVIECVQLVARIDPQAKGVDAVNSRCHDGGDECAERSNPDDDGGYALFCSENTCQISCENNPDCPPAWVCAEKGGVGKGPKYCQLPTCPPEDANVDAVSSTGR